MPSSITHYEFCKDLVKNEDYRDIFLLASQGPDTLFFYGYTLAKRENRKDVSGFGFYLHSINPSKLYYTMLAHANNDKENKDLFIEFTRGFMYHYVLDRVVHPYVFYNTGFPYTNKKYSIGHGNFEGTLDTLMKIKNNDNISNRKAIKTRKSLVKLCSKFFYEVIKELYPDTKLNELSYYKAYKDFRFVRMVLDSKHGVKKAIFKTLCPNSPINTLCQPIKIDDKNYLNNNHQTWLIPESGKEVNYSLDDLFIKAIEQTRQVDTIIYNYKENIVTQRKINKFTDNINHDGRHVDQNMIYFTNIYRKEK